MLPTMPVFPHPPDVRDPDDPAAICAACECRRDRAIHYSSVEFPWSDANYWWAGAKSRCKLCGCVEQINDDGHCQRCAEVAARWAGPSDIDGSGGTDG